MKSTQHLCPCHSKKEYSVCCQPFHDGKSPKTALQLMRSRYAAYALNKVDYIIFTTHIENPRYLKDKLSWKKGISQFSQNTSFENLEIHDFQEKGNEATVTFTAYIKQSNHEATFTEKSGFEKVAGQWLYKSAQIIPIVV